jgi:hypothetical protein
MPAPTNPLPPPVNILKKRILNSIIKIYKYYQTRLAVPDYN